MKVPFEILEEYYIDRTETFYLLNEQGLNKFRKALTHMCNTLGRFKTFKTKNPFYIEDCVDKEREKIKVILESKFSEPNGLPFERKLFSKYSPIGDFLEFIKNDYTPVELKIQEICLDGDGITFTPYPNSHTTHIWALNVEFDQM